MFRPFVAVCAAILAVTGCSDHPERPIVDGYTLQGVVLDAQTGARVSDVTVLIGLETQPEEGFHDITVTNTNGEFTIKPFPATAPNIEILRLTKPGYESREVLARTATRLEDYRYSLEVRLQPLPNP
jgi:hypothetical protein